MGDVTPVGGGSGGLFDAALENLVRQFARPLDCLRELVQNSIDAGSPRVEVTLGWTPREGELGVLSIAVRDFGEGMDEHVIDNELTRMFASSKAGDLGKIGRFGIGFTSVFAIAPEVVHVVTGRHGSGWELVFHDDRSFDKHRLNEPRRGTCITLYKTILEHRRMEWRRDIEDALTFWCEHCQIPITLDDRALLEGPEAASADSTEAADPFEAFAEPRAPVARTINRPLDLNDARWVVHRTEADIEVFVGLGHTPAYRWYNGGLTLLSTSDPACLGEHHTVLGHLRFKVQYRGLEHTLTRDNVIQDDAWKKVIDVLGRAAAELEHRVAQSHADAAAGGHDLEPTLRALARVADHTGALPKKPAVVLPVLHGSPAPLPARADQVEVARVASPLTAALHASGRTVFQDRPELRAIARVRQRPLPGAVDQRWVLVETDGVTAPSLDGPVRRLLERAGVTSLTVHWCRIHGKDTPLAIARSPGATPMRREALAATLLGRLLGVRRVWVDTSHENVRLAAKLARVAPEAAAFAVLQGVFAQWDGLRGRRFEAIRRAVLA